MSLVGDFEKGVGSIGRAVSNVAKGAEYVAEHPDKVINTAGKVINYAAQHPGEVGKIAAKELVHSFTDPKELAINAALLVGTAGTGILAKEAAEVGAKTAVEVGTKVVAETAAKTAAETGTKVAAETVGKAATEVGEKAIAETATKAAGEASGRTLEQKLLETGTHNPIQQRVTAFREGMAQKFLNAGAGDTPSALRQAGAALIQGSSGTAPKQLEGMSDTAHAVQKLAWRGQQINKQAGRLHGASEGLQAAANPVGYAMSKAGSGGRGNGGDTPSTPTSAYGPDPSRSSSFAYGSTTPQGDTTVSSVTAPQAPAAAPSMRSRMSEFNQTGKLTTQGGWGIQVGAKGPKGMHFWQGPQREALGGIGMDYDWRNMGPLRPTQQGTKFLIGGKKGVGGAEGGAESITGGSVTAGVPAKPIKPMASMSAKAGLAMEPPSEGESQYAYDAKGGQGRFTFPELSQPQTSAGPRILQPAGTGGDRGAQQGRGDAFVSGSVYGVAADTTLGGTAAWNNTGQGSFVFPQLDKPPSQQPTDITEVGNFSSSPFANRNKALPPLSQPMKRPNQLLGV